MDDEYDAIADKNFSPRTPRGTINNLPPSALHGANHAPRSPDRHVNFVTTPNVQVLPSSIDDEFDDYGIVTTVDLSLIRNAAANALKALQTLDATSVHEEVPVTLENCLRPLECTPQNYAWGKLGSNALVARLKAAQNAEFAIQEDQPYAELWLGTHPNGMSQIILPVDDHEPNSDKDDEPAHKRLKKVVPLLDYVKSNPQLHCGVVGTTSPSEDYDLTFLLKVLSIHKVLSIQAHPDKLLAGQLHTDFPDRYKDPNHKPEMAIALSDDFQALCGFRDIRVISKHLHEYPELAHVVGLDLADHVHEASKAHLHHPPKKVLKHFFRAYMEAPQAQVDPPLAQLLARLQAKSNAEQTELDALLVTLAAQFPGDAGIFSPLLLNHVKLTKGQAFYIGANEPHAYIQGDILECMACSDNVVRAGLTPKFKDVETLVKMLTYNCSRPEVVTGKQINEFCRLYCPPVDDFAMEMIQLQPGQHYKLPIVRSPSVLLTLEGSGLLKQGQVQTWECSFGKAAFMSANTTAIVYASDSEPLHLVRALSNVHLPK